MSASAKLRLCVDRRNNVTTMVLQPAKERGRGLGLFLPFPSSPDSLAAGSGEEEMPVAASDYRGWLITMLTLRDVATEDKL